MSNYVKCGFMFGQKVRINEILGKITYYDNYEVWITSARNTIHKFKYSELSGLIII